MRKMIVVTLTGFAVALGGCSKQDTHQASAEVKTAADKIADSAKDAAHSPEVKKLGAEIKDAAKDAAHVTKEAAKGAAQGAREGAAQVEAKSNDAGDHAKDASDTSKK